MPWTKSSNGSMSSTLITGAMSTADDRVRGWWTMNMSSGDRVLEPTFGDTPFLLAGGPGK
jgi:hypothetical protein